MIKPIDIALAGGGILLAGLTLHTYRGFDTPQGRPSQNKLSPQEAEVEASSAKSYLTSNPEDFNAWSELAIADYYRGPNFYADALNALDRARALGATSESLFYYAGVMYEALGLPDYAANELSKYLRHYPEDYETQVRLANLLAQEKKTEDAYKLYQALSKRWPHDPTLWFNFGMVSKDKGDLDGALSCFHHVLELTKQMPEGGFYQEGEIARLKNNEDEAMRLYQQELSLHPEFLPALISLETVQRHKGLWKDARETRKKIADLKSPPSNNQK